MNILEKMTAYQREQSAAIQNSEESIAANNWKMLNSMLVIGCFTFGMVFLMSLFLQPYRELTPFYAAVVLFLILYLFCTKRVFYNRNPVLLIYTGYGAMIAYSIYSSAFVTPDDTCVTILFFLFQLPVIIVDKSWRVNLIESVFLLLYLSLAVPLKNSSLVIEEILNSVLFAGVGMILGEYMRKIKIDNFELNRQATLREKFDYLTGLGNRRSLFERLEKTKDLQDTAILMLDVDKFKLYNDTYGHQKGDECLKQICSFLMEFGKSHGAVFYRYGGEEFVGIVGNCGGRDLLGLCRLINQSVHELKIPHKSVKTGFVTVSIGLSAYESRNPADYKELLTQADIALYCAKENGRNRSVKYEDSMSGRL